MIYVSQDHLKKWNKINDFKDCPPLNKKVMVIHDENVYAGVFEKDGSERFCWRLEDEYGIQWVDIFEVELWLDTEMMSLFQKTNVAVRL